MKRKRLGKHVGSVVYAHREYEDLVVPKDLLQMAKEAVPSSFEYTYVKYDKKEQSVSFMYSPDFDTANEPVVTAGWRFSSGQAKKIAIPKDPEKQQIIHGKHLFVDDGYAGFDREEAKGRWDSYQGRPGMDKNRMGRRDWWKNFMNEDISSSRGEVVKKSIAPIDSGIIEAMLLVTEGFGYEYRMPKDREKRLYDFYLLSLYHGYMFGNSRGMQDSYRKRADILPGMDEDTRRDLEKIVEEGIQNLVDDMQADLLNAVVISVASEFRHIVDNNSEESMKIFLNDMGVFDQFSKWTRHLHRKIGEKNMYKSIYARPGERMAGSSDTYDAAFKALKSSGWKIDDFMKVALAGFKDMDWAVCYGGNAWKQIVEAWFKLKNAKSISEKQIWIDHVFNLEHNTGTMLNKVKRFKKYGGFDWIKRALDAKFNMAPLELAELSSIPMSVVGRLNRLTGVHANKDSSDYVRKPNKVENSTTKIKGKTMTIDFPSHEEDDTSRLVVQKKTGGEFDVIVFKHGNRKPYTTMTFKPNDGVSTVHYMFSSMHHIFDSTTSRLVAEKIYNSFISKNTSEKPRDAADTMMLGDAILVKKSLTDNNKSVVMKFPPNKAGIVKVEVKMDNVSFTNREADTFVGKAPALPNVMSKILSDMLSMRLAKTDPRVKKAVRQIIDMQDNLKKLNSKPKSKNEKRTSGIGWIFDQWVNNDGFVLMPNPQIGQIHYFVIDDRYISMKTDNGTKKYDNTEDSLDLLVRDLAKELKATDENYHTRKAYPEEHAELIVHQMLSMYNQKKGDA